MTRPTFTLRSLNVFEILAKFLHIINSLINYTKTLSCIPYLYSSTAYLDFLRDFKLISRLKSIDFTMFLIDNDEGELLSCIERRGKKEDHLWPERSLYATTHLNIILQKSTTYMSKAMNCADSIFIDLDKIQGSTELDYNIRVTKTRKCLFIEDSRPSKIGSDKMIVMYSNQLDLFVVNNSRLRHHLHQYVENNNTNFEQNILSKMLASLNLYFDTESISASTLQKCKKIALFTKDSELADDTFHKLEAMEEILDSKHMNQVLGSLKMDCHEDLKIYKDKLTKMLPVNSVGQMNPNFEAPKKEKPKVAFYTMDEILEFEIAAGNKMKELPKVKNT